MRAVAVGRPHRALLDGDLNEQRHRDSSSAQCWAKSVSCAEPAGLNEAGAERLSADDLAAARDAQWTAAAVAQARTLAGHRQATPGRCSWCNQQCLPLAVYCDDDCRADHEAHQATLRRQGRTA